VCYLLWRKQLQTQKVIFIFDSLFDVNPSLPNQVEIVATGGSYVDKASALRVPCTLPIICSSEYLLETLQIMATASAASHGRFKNLVPSFHGAFGNALCQIIS
jgi:hypothetical protein